MFDVDGVFEVGTGDEESLGNILVMLDGDPVVFIGALRGGDDVAGKYPLSSDILVKGPCLRDGSSVFGRLRGMIDLAGTSLAASAMTARMSTLSTSTDEYGKSWR